MTERIDLDDLDTADDEETSSGNYGDWFWRGEGDPDREPDAPELESFDGRAMGADRLPRVPRADADRPAGVPAEQGGSGAGAVPTDSDRAGAATNRQSESIATEESENPSMAVGVDDMTMAITLTGLNQLGSPKSIVSDAREWADWVGMVGEVGTPELTQFQREHDIEMDFFNGTGTGPAERLADINETSMFYASRMVVVGLPEEEWIAEEAGWEFVPLAKAAEKAGWEY